MVGIDVLLRNGARRMALDHPGYLPFFGKLLMTLTAAWNFSSVVMVWFVGPERYARLFSFLRYTPFSAIYWPLVAGSANAALDSGLRDSRRRESGSSVSGSNEKKRGKTEYNKRVTDHRLMTGLAIVRPVIIQSLQRMRVKWSRG